MKILIPRAFSHFREHKPSCEIRLICSCCRCAHSGSVSFPPPDRQSLKSMQSLNCIETLNFHEGNDILYHLQGQLASGFKPRSREGNAPFHQLLRLLHPRFKPRSREGNDATGAVGGCDDGESFNPRSHEGNDPAREKGGAMNDMFQSTFPRGERLL